MTTERVLAFAPENEGLDARDRERAASLADEGGAAGAIVERQESRPPRTPSAIAVACAAAAGVLAAIVAWRLREEVTMKSASMPTAMPTPRPRPDPPRAPEAKRLLPREDDGWNRFAAFDDDCETPARPFRVPAELLEGQR